MTELTPIPTEQRHVYYDALVAGRAEAERLGYGMLDDRIFAAFHRALYRPMLDAHEKAVLNEASAKLVAWADESGDKSLTGPAGTRRRTLHAAARKIAPEWTTAEVAQAFVETMRGQRPGFICHTDAAGQSIPPSEEPTR